MFNNAAELLSRAKISRLLGPSALWLVKVAGIKDQL